MSLAGGAILVTGAAHGIGRACAERLVAEGARVCAVDVEGGALAALAARLGEAVVPVVGDLRAEATLAAARGALTGLGGCGGVVNNAGVMVRVPLAELDLEAWRAALELNLTAPLRVVRALEAELRAARGAVVNIASTRARMSEPHTEAYAASKGGLVALTHALAVSLGPEVRVNAVSPGWIDVSGAGPGREAETLRPVDHAQHPVGRVGRPEDMAEAVAWLLDGARSGFLTGAEIVIDGGMTRRMIYAE